MKRAERSLRAGGLDVIAVGDFPPRRAVVVLHGRLMRAADLVPFAHSLDLSATLFFPDAPLPAARGYSWWPSDEEERARRGGAIDLFELDPPGRAEARARLGALCDEIADGIPLALVGFSQGGMLAMDYVLHGGRVDALALLSSSRIAFDDWQPRLHRLADLPMLATHGHADDELPFPAGIALRDAARTGGALVEWLPFDEGHVIPLVAWRALRRFLRAQGFDPPADDHA